jgi:hypothetical protein
MTRDAAIEAGAGRKKIDGVQTPETDVSGVETNPLEESE